MCFHSKQTSAAVTLQNRYKASFIGVELYRPKHNINGFEHPAMPIICNDSPDKIQLFQWGLIPNWANDRTIQSSTLNAKLETVTQKPTFKNVIHQRCLIPANGFYEWKWLNSSGSKKEKYLITCADTDVFSFAGLWSKWLDPQIGKWVNSFTILTTEANDLMAEIHNIKKRMPVILTPETEMDWLTSSKAPTLNQNLIAQCLEENRQMRLFV